MLEQEVYRNHLQREDAYQLNEQQYQALYQHSITDPDSFWAAQAEQFLTWSKPWQHVSDWDYQSGHINWFTGAEINACYNCIDRHLALRAEQTAIIWEGDEPDTSRHISYQQLHAEVARLANWMRQQGVGKGDRVCIYMPMVVEVTYAMMACARIGAIHSVVFAGFSPDALADRINDSQCVLLVTAAAGRRGGQTIPLKNNVDQALHRCPSIKQVLVAAAGATDIDDNIDWQSARDVWYHDAVANMSSDCPCEPMQANDPLFILYTSGSTGKPKGILHGTGGYLLYCAISHKYSFDYRAGEVFWCSADAGWVTGHSYMIYGPLLNGAITLLYEGVPSYPDAARFWQIVDKHQVNILYTAPTIIRALMGAGDQYLANTSRASLRILATVGEPINPEAWRWFYHHVGKARCPIIDTWWQTETGGHMITPLPGATALKPGSASRPFFGVQPQILDESGQVIDGPGEGVLVIAGSWPGQMQTIYGDQQRFMQTYLQPYPGKYFSGDGARRDEDGYYWITGRVDDVLNVSGHRLGTAEIESALVLHPAINEAAVVGYPHAIKGQAIYAYVSLMADAHQEADLKQQLVALVRKEIGPIATIDKIQCVQALPKTRSGKIMRRILRKIAHHDIADLGDTSTLSDPGVIAALIAGAHADT